MSKFYTILLILISTFVFGQISTQIDTAHIKIGQPIQYQLSVDVQAKDQIVLPQLKDTLSFHIEILDQSIDTLKDGDKKKLIQKLSLTSFDPGEFLIRSLPVVINNDTLLTNSFQIQVEDVEIDSANLSGFPIKPIMDEEFTWKDYWDKYWLYFLVGGIVFLVLLIIAILFLRNKKRTDSKKVTIKTPYEEAKDSLKNLDKKKLIEKGNVTTYYAELSFILRKYLGRVFEFSSLEMLSDDLIRYFTQTSHLNKEQVQQLKEFLYESDLAKFAKVIPEKEKHEFYRIWTENLIDQIKPIDIPEEELPELRPNEKYRKLE